MQCPTLPFAVERVKNSLLKEHMLSCELLLTSVTKLFVSVLLCYSVEYHNCVQFRLVLREYILLSITSVMIRNICRNTFIYGAV